MTLQHALSFDPALETEKSESSAGEPHWISPPATVEPEMLWASPSWRKRLGWGLLPLVAGAWLLATAAVGMPFDKPGILFLPFVVCAACFGGLASGLIAVAVSLLCIIYSLFGPWSAPIDEEIAWVKLEINGFGLPTLAIALGLMKRRGDRAASRFAAAAASLHTQNAQIEWERRYNDERSNADRQTQERQSRMQMAFQVARMGAWDWDLLTNINSWSPEHYDLFGIAPGTPIDYDVWAVALDPRDREIALAAIQRALDGRDQEYHAEYRIVLPDGRIRWLECRARVDRKEGVPQRMLGVAQDITHRKQTDEALRISSGRLRLALQAARMGEWMIHGPTGETSWSPELFPLFGLSPDSKPYSHAQWLEVVHPDDRLRCQEIYSQIVSSGGDFCVEYRVYWPDGSCHWIESRGVAEMTHGKLHRVAGIEFNTDERHRASEAAREAAERMRSIIASSPAFFIMGDEQLVVREWNPQSSAVFGYSKEEAVGKSLLDLRIIPPESLDRCQQLLRRATAGESMSAIEGQRLHRSGRRIDVNISLAGLTDVNGERCWIAFGVDITESRRLREQLLQSQRLETVGQLAGGIAHDFNNLLAVVGGYSESLRRRIIELGNDASAISRLDEIGRATDRGTVLVRQLLVFSRRQSIAPDRLDLNAVIAGVLPMLSKLVGQSVTLESELGAEVPGVLADLGQIEQVLLNLAVNAKDAMPAGGRVHIKTGCRAISEVEAAALSVPAGEYAWVRVRDTGCGMDRVTCQQAFEPFFTTKEGNGTGLGLSIVHGIISQAGGAITVRSELGGGAEFEILLPAADMSSPVLM